MHALGGIRDEHVVDLKYPDIQKGIRENLARRGSLTLIHHFPVWAKHYILPPDGEIVIVQYHLRISTAKLVETYDLIMNY